MSAVMIFKMNSALYAMLLFAIMVIACSSPNKPKAEKPKVDIPVLLLNRFAAIYPKAEEVEWKIGKNQTYEVDFIQDKQQVKVVFLADGMIQQTEVKTDVTAIPPAAASFITESLGAKQIDAASKVVDGFGTLTWKIRIHQEEYLFGSDGQLIGRMIVDTTNENAQ